MFTKILDIMRCEANITFLSHFGTGFPVSPIWQIFTTRDERNTDIIIITKLKQKYIPARQK